MNSSFIYTIVETEFITTSDYESLIMVVINHLMGV
jgi:hypothetical protein